MLRLEIRSEGTAYSDFECEEILLGFVDLSNSGSDVTLCASTDNIFYALRVAVLGGKIDLSDVVVNLGEDDLLIDQNGRLPEWGNYTSYWERCLDKLF